MAQGTNGPGWLAHTSSGGVGGGSRSAAAAVGAAGSMVGRALRAWPARLRVAGGGRRDLGKAGPGGVGAGGRGGWRDPGGWHGWHGHRGGAWHCGCGMGTAKAAGPGGSTSKAAGAGRSHHQGSWAGRFYRRGGRCCAQSWDPGDLEGTGVWGAGPPCCRAVREGRRNIDGPVARGSTKVRG